MKWWPARRDLLGVGADSWVCAGCERRRPRAPCFASGVDGNSKPSDGRRRVRRRRGAALEADILDAAWEELQERGWAGFRIEGVAARCGTGKAAIYARWPNRLELVLAATTRSAEVSADTWSSRGELRSDLVAYLEGVALFVSGPHGQALRALVSAAPPGGGAIDVFVRDRTAIPALIVEAAQRRGELAPGPVDPLVLRIGQMVIGHMWLMTGLLEPGITDHVVDALWLPALKAVGVVRTSTL